MRGFEPRLPGFQLGDLIEVQEVYKNKGGPRQWYTGIVAYDWFEDFEPWTGYAIQLLQCRNPQVDSN